MKKINQPLFDKSDQSSLIERIRSLEKKIEWYKVKTKNLKNTISLQKESLKSFAANDKKKDLVKSKDTPSVITENTLLNFVTRYWELVSHLPEIIFEIDSTGKITFLNLKAFEGNGYSIMDFKKGLTMFNIFTPEDIPRAKMAFENAKKGKELSGEEFTIQTQSGAKILVMVFTNNMFQDGVWMGVRGVAIDITSKREAENKEKQYHEKLMFMGKAALEFLEMKHDDNLFAYIGQTLSELIGKSIVSVFSFNDANSVLNIEYFSKLNNLEHKFSEILGFPWNLFSVKLNRENIEFLKERSEHLFKVDNEFLEHCYSLLPINLCEEIENLLSTNTIYAISLMYSRNLYGIVVVMKELNDPKEKTMIESFVYQSATALHRRQLENELIKAKEKAEETDKLKTAFLANMSHEIRTPLNGILGLTQLMHNPALSEETRKEYLSLITINGKLLLNLVNDIIDISRIESNQIEINEDVFSLSSLFQDIEKLFKSERMARKKENLELKFSKCLNTSIHTITGDFQKIRQIFTNLLSNAIKFTTEGQIEVGCCLQDEETILFHVKDTGIGLSDEQLENVFNRFTQVDQSLTRSYGGSGLGLAICKGLVEKMGGKIWAKSDGEKGSEFYFTLPFKPSAIKPDTPSGEIEDIDRINWSDLCILVVEDNYVSFHLFQVSLQKTGVKILHADTGYKAIEMVEQNKDIDLVLMDIQLPVLNGYEATKKIKKIRPGLPVIAQTANATDEDRILCINAGCSDYLTKPINLDRLYEILNKYLFINKK